MNEHEFKRRTKRLGLGVIEFVETMPRMRTADVIGRQLLRCATSIGANYRAACRGRSPADMIAKLGIVEEEADETMYWLEMLVESKLAAEERVAALLKETDEILAMTVASIKTLRNRNS
jgi:four helix bundle protein